MTELIICPLCASERTLGLLGRAAEGSHDDDVHEPYKPKLCEKSGLSQVQSAISFLRAISNRLLMRKLMIRDAAGRARPNSSAKRSVEKDGHFIPDRNSFILHCYRKFPPLVGAATNDRDFVLSKCGALALLIVRNVTSGRDLVTGIPRSLS